MEYFWKRQIGTVNDSQKGNISQSCHQVRSDRLENSLLKQYRFEMDNYLLHNYYARISKWPQWNMLVTAQALRIK